MDQARAGKSLEPLFCCSECRGVEKPRTIDSLREHIASSHLDIGLYKCPKCPEEFVTPHMAFYHMQRVCRIPQADLRNPLKYTKPLMQMDFNALRRLQIVENESICKAFNKMRTAPPPPALPTVQKVFLVHQEVQAKQPTAEMSIQTEADHIEPGFARLLDTMGELGVYINTNYIKLPKVGASRTESSDASASHEDDQPSASHEENQPGALEEAEHQEQAARMSPVSEDGDEYLSETDAVEEEALSERVLPPQSPAGSSSPEDSPSQEDWPDSEEPANINIRTKTEPRDDYDEVNTSSSTGQSTSSHIVPRLPSRSSDFNDELDNIPLPAPPTPPHLPPPRVEPPGSPSLPRTTTTTQKRIKPEPRDDYWDQPASIACAPGSLKRAKTQRVPTAAPVPPPREEIPDTPASPEPPKNPFKRKIKVEIQDPDYPACQPGPTTSSSSSSLQEPGLSVKKTRTSAPVEKPPAARSSRRDQADDIDSVEIQDTPFGMPEPIKVSIKTEPIYKSGYGGTGDEEEQEHEEHEKDGETQGDVFNGPQRFAQDKRPKSRTTEDRSYKQKTVYKRQFHKDHICRFEECCDVGSRLHCNFCKGQHYDHNGPEVTSITDRHIWYRLKNLCPACGQVARLPHKCRPAVCNFCHKTGHLAALCPSRENEATLQRLKAAKMLEPDKEAEVLRKKREGAIVLEKRRFEAGDHAVPSGRASTFLPNYRIPKRQFLTSHVCEYAQCCNLSCTSICTFCSGYHRDLHCPTVASFNEREMLYRHKNLCPYCHKKMVYSNKHKPHKCSTSPKSICHVCNHFGHRPALCPGFPRNLHATRKLEREAIILTVRRQTEGDGLVHFE